jgi:hypothetical protein
MLIYDPNARGFAANAGAFAHPSPGTLRADPQQPTRMGLRFVSLAFASPASEYKV